MRTKVRTFATMVVLVVAPLVGVGLGGGCAGESPAQEGDMDLGEAVEALQPPTCLGGIDANGTALGPIDAGTTVCGQGSKSWLCDAAGQWQYVGAACTVANVPPAPSCSCAGGTDANGTALGPVACSSTICGGGFKSWLCNASGQWQNVGAICSVGVGPTPPAVGCSGGSLADGTVLGLISANTTICGGGFKTWLCTASLQWQYVGGNCSVPSCSNGVLDPGELETDCGGACLCAPGQFCVKGADCANGLCSSNVCSSNLCVANNVTCPVPSNPCQQVGTCSPATGVCSAATNKATGAVCNDGNPTTSGDSCQSGVCIPTATCGDGIKNQGETGADCGGPCANGGGTPCSTGKLGACAAGTTVCAAGGIVCQQNVQSTTETCNGIDDNCNGSTDEGITGFACGSCSQGITLCSGGALSCINPSAGLSTYYVDSDSDGYGGSSTVQACSKPGGYATNAGDCNDSDYKVHPGAAEVCSGIDENCNGSIDESASGLCQAYEVCQGGGCCYGAGVAPGSPGGNAYEPFTSCATQPEEQQGYYVGRVMTMSDTDVPWYTYINAARCCSKKLKVLSYSPTVCTYGLWEVRCAP